MDSTTQKDETTLPTGEGEKETVKHDGNQYAAGTNRLTEGFSPGQYQELAENSSAVADTSEERDKKLVDAIGSIVMNPIEGISKQDKWNIKEPEKEVSAIQKTMFSEHLFQHPCLSCQLNFLHWTGKRFSHRRNSTE